MNQKIVQICGLCGSGKSTIANKLKKDFNATIYDIGEYRKKYKDEDITWYQFVEDIKSDNNKFIIVETTGVNMREGYLYGIPNIRIFLHAPKKELEKRIDRKPIFERGWKILKQPKVFDEFRDKKDFNKKCWNELKKLKKECIVIDTKEPIEKVYSKVLNKIGGKVLWKK